MNDDLRGFIEKLYAANEIIEVKDVDWNLEIGAITEVGAELKSPAFLFDKIKDYPEGFRVAANLLTVSKRRQKIALGFTEDVSDLDVVKIWKNKLRDFRPVSPKEVSDGPVMENVMEGENINLFKFPAPKWHEHDGGRYIGTGDIVITMDPEEGWINMGTYRVMIHDEKTLSFFVAPGHHAYIMREKYWARGRNCPVVMCFGQDPLLWICSTLPLPWGVSELDFAGFLSGEPIKVIRGKYTGLPIPATAEIAIEGESPPPSIETREEGPFGEWTGYYASGSRIEPIIKVKAVYYRNNPIIHGELPCKINPAWHPIPIHSAPLLWTLLERAGIEGIKGVWVHGRGNMVIPVISIEQLYSGHAKRVASVAAGVMYGVAMAGKWVIVVDDDVDPSNWDEVLWALCTRCDPESSIDIVRGYPDTPLDPIIPPEKRERKDWTQSKVLITACKPYNWKKEFPPVAEASPELKERALRKLKTLYPGLFSLTKNY
ncbi:MAG: UbiD family decarboxylase [Candidatus Bathyarchaeia archaeon]